MGWFRRSKDKTAPETDGREAAAAAPDAAPPNAQGDQATPVPDRLADFFLVFEEHLTEVEKEDVDHIVARLRKPPALLERVSRGLDDPEELTEAVTSDPTLSADVLRTVNSAAFHLAAPISSIQHAVTYLGTNMVKGLVLQATVGQLLELESPAQHTAYMRLWRASYIASAVAQELGKAVGSEDPSVLATRALLANIGDLALVSARADLASLYAAHAPLFDRVAGQQEAIVANSAIIGATLARRWALPADLEHSLRYQLVPMAWPPERFGETGLDSGEQVLVWFAMLVGDATSFGASRNLADFAIDRPDALEYVYLPAYLRASGHRDLPALLQDPDTRGKLQRVIDRFGE